VWKVFETTCCKWPDYANASTHHKYIIVVIAIEDQRGHLFDFLRWSGEGEGCEEALSCHNGGKGVENLFSELINCGRADKNHSHLMLTDALLLAFW